MYQTLPFYNPDTTISVTSSAPRMKLVLDLTTFYDNLQETRRVHVEHEWPSDAVRGHEVLDVCQDAIRAAGYDWLESE